MRAAETVLKKLAAPRSDCPAIGARHPAAGPVRRGLAQSRTRTCSSRDTRAPARRSSPHIGRPTSSVPSARKHRHSRCCSSARPVTTSPTSRAWCGRWIQKAESSSRTSRRCWTDRRPEEPVVRWHRGRPQRHRRACPPVRCPRGDDPQACQDRAFRPDGTARSPQGRLRPHPVQWAPGQPVSDNPEDSAWMARLPGSTKRFACADTSP